MDAFSLDEEDEKENEDGTKVSLLKGRFRGIVCMFIFFILPKHGIKDKGTKESKARNRSKTRNCKALKA